MDKEDTLSRTGSSVGDTCFNRESTMASLTGVTAEIENTNELWDLVHQKGED